jgi:topoisomerase-4 subunit B
MTFFFREMPQLIADGHLYLAQPPLFRIAAGGEIAYARDEADRDRLIARRFKGKKVEISRFKGLGEMSARQLRETTMDPATRTLERVEIDAAANAPVGELVEQLMGRRPELRLAFIQANAKDVEELDL